MTSLEMPDLNDPNWPTRLVEQLLSGLLIDTGGVQLGIRLGFKNLTFSASTAPTGAVTVLHGLGRTPAAVLIGNPYKSGVVAVTGFYEQASVTATQFLLSGTASAVYTGTAAVSWAVIG